MSFHSALARLVGCLALAGCATAPERPVDTGENLAQFQRAGCYTVDLFDPIEVRSPGPDVPDDHAAFIGHWGGGVWNGDWCHELIVLDVSAHGEVTLMDMHAPSQKYTSPATAFRRKGRIFDDGTLRFVHGTVTRRYAIRDGRLHGSRSGDGYGEMRIVMTRQGVSPMPRPRPVRIAKN